jgi:hypothetical protein
MPSFHFSPLLKCETFQGFIEMALRIPDGWKGAFAFRERVVVIAVSNRDRLSGHQQHSTRVREFGKEEQQPKGSREQTRTMVILLFAASKSEKRKD